MFTITNKQLESMELVVEDQNIRNLMGLLKRDYPEHYIKKNNDEWPPYIKQKISVAKSWEIATFENQFLVVLATLEYPQHFSGEIPAWVTEIMEWPDREENDKLILLYKELIKRSEPPTKESDN
jgi:hypothetical protein